MFITFEGIDGCGKSTQSQLAADALTTQSIPNLLTLNPGGTPLGQELRQILLHHQGPVDDKAELLLYIADRVQHMAHVVQPALDNNQIVLCDRFADSTLAYQGYGRGIPRILIDELHKHLLGNIQPTLTFWFAGTVTTLLSRAQQRRNPNQQADRLEQEKLDFYHRVHDGFAAIAAANPKRVIQLDATQPIDELHTQVMAAIMAKGLPRQPHPTPASPC